MRFLELFIFIQLKWKKEVSYRNMFKLNDNNLTIIVWDVQHGNSTYIRTPNGTQIIQDLGIGSYSEPTNGFSPLIYLQNRYKVKYLNQIIISHPDLDHIADILNLKYFSFQRFSRPHSISVKEIEEKIQSTNNTYYREIFKRYIQIISEWNFPIQPETDPTLPENNGGVRFKIFYPVPDISTNRTNNHSLVTVISYASSKIILTGDNEAPSWKFLLDNSDFVREIKDTDIFLAPHHGRENGYHKDLFDIFKPKLTIISDGNVCDTSATSRYSNISKGWTVWKKEANGAVNKISRNCLTTRKDGAICIKIGYNQESNPFLYVRI